MSSYSFQGSSRIWTPRDEEENRAIFSARKQERCIKVEMPSELHPVYPNNDYEFALCADPKSEKWSLKQLTRLLRLYGAHRCLWDTRDLDNRNRKLRKAALVDITAAMGSGLCCAQVVQKINVLRSTYRYEKRRIKQRIRKGIGAKTKLKWFALADAFLRDVPRPEKFRKVEDLDTDSDLEDAVVFTIDPESLIPIDEDEEDFDCADGVVKKEIFEPSSPFNQDDMHSSIALVTNPTETEIKLENTEGFCSTAHTADYATSAEPNTSANNQTWTWRESLKFVQLLGHHPSLWHFTKLDDCSTQSEEQQAVAEIAAEMQMPAQRIERRVLTFRRVYEGEAFKISKNSYYKPNWIWWAEAQKFMSVNNAPTLHEEHFVDANEVPPPTPLNIQLMQLRSVQQEPNKSETEDSLNEVEAETSAIAVNDETEVAVDDSSCSNAEAVRDISRESPQTVGDNLPPMPTTTSTDNTDAKKPATKLIWNGLEEDLLGGKWSLKHSVKFLRLYGAHRCLWDLHDSDYRSRELRNAAIEDIAAAMGYGLDADYVARKIKIFRITYMQHRKRMLEAIKQGKEPDIQLRWFPLADSFLRPHIGLRSIKEHEREMPQFDLQYVYANLNLIDPALLTDFRGKGTQNTIEIGLEAAQTARQKGVV